MVTIDLNAKVSSNKTSLENMIGRHGLGDRNNYSGRFVDFNKVRYFIIEGTLFEQRAWRKNSDHEDPMDVFTLFFSIIVYNKGPPLKTFGYYVVRRHQS